MAADLARSPGKRNKENPMKCWPELKVVKPQKLHIARTKCASEENILQTILKSQNKCYFNDFINCPDRIYNIDETGISTNNNPINIVCTKETNPQAVTSAKSTNVTIIAAANALCPLSMYFQESTGLMNYNKGLLLDQVTQCLTRVGPIYNSM